MRVGVPQKRWRGPRAPNLPKPPKLPAVTHKKAVFAAGIFALVLGAIGLFILYDSRPYLTVYGEAQTSKSRAEIQAELDQEVQENMMTVSVSPVMNLEADGMLTCNLENDTSNKFAQRFTITQNGNTVFISESVVPGKCITSAKTSGATAGSALIEIQALDPETFDAHGSPTVVEVSITSANA